MAFTRWQEDSPILTDKKYAQYASFPVRYPLLVKQYDDQEAVLWTEKEISFGDDINQFKAGLFKNPQQDAKAKKMLLYVSGFFLYADGLIGLSLGSVLQPLITVREIIDFYALQNYIETVHNKFYSVTIESLYPGQRDDIQANLPKYPAIRGKVAWVEKWVKSSHSITEASDIAAPRPSVQHLILANTIIESIFFTPSFAVIYYFKQYGKLPALASGNDMVSRDENMHRKYGCSVYNMVESEYKLPAQVVVAMIKEAVAAEQAFIHEAMGGENLEGFALADAMAYPEYIADLLAVDLGYEKIYNIRNPFPWILTMSIEPKKNFFEKVVTEYQNAYTVKSREKRTDGFDFSANPDF